MASTVEVSRSRTSEESIALRVQRVLARAQKLRNRNFLTAHLIFGSLRDTPFASYQVTERSKTNHRVMARRLLCTTRRESKNGSEVFNLAQYPLIRLLASYIRVDGRKLLGGCCFYYLFCSSLHRHSSS
jgi:hypothetical protein